MLSLVPLTLALLTPASANSTGKTGKSTTGCTSCHGTSADTNVTVAFSSSVTEVAPGDTITIEMTVSSADTSHTAAGLNVSASDGTLVAGTNTQVVSSEITHSAPNSYTTGSVTFDFDWTAPSTAGTVTFYGAGNSVNENGGTSGDGWGLASDLEIAVVCPDDDDDSYTTCDGDCDDADPDINPGAPELCDSVDNDCNGSIDDNATDGSTFYLDSDSDGFGDPFNQVVDCTAPSGYVADSNDCDDARAAVNPDATEVCDTLDLDEDCDGYSDDDDDTVTGVSDWYIDADEDGYGIVTVGGQACDPPAGGADNPDDCDDTRPEVNPGADETCDATEDLNCDGFVGLGDNDGDGFSACVECDDSDPNVNPDAVEVCNGIDDNCDELVDPDDSADAGTWYEDADFDGYGTSASTTTACEQPHGYASNTDDCDDTTAGVHPDAIEIYYDGIDQDCDSSTVDDDQDGDGAAFDADCDDLDPTKQSEADCAEPEDTGPVVDDDTGEAGDDGGGGAAADDGGCGGDKSLAVLGLLGFGGLAARRRRRA